MLRSFLFVFFLQTLQTVQILSCVRCELGSSPSPASSRASSPRYFVIALDSSDSGPARIQTEHGVTDISQITQHFSYNKNPGCQYKWQIVRTRYHSKYSLWNPHNYFLEANWYKYTALLEYFLPIKRADLPRSLLSFVPPVTKTTTPALVK